MLAIVYFACLLGYTRTKNLTSYRVGFTASGNMQRRRLQSFAVCSFRQGFACQTNPNAAMPLPGVQGEPPMSVKWIRRQASPHFGAFPVGLQALCNSHWRLGECMGEVRVEHSGMHTCIK